jgi:hypothetical protein
VSYRKFVDRAGQAWQVRDRSRWEWSFEPEGGNPGPARTVRAPGYQDDPFELSAEELQRLLDSARTASTRRAPNPFGD